MRVISFFFYYHLKIPIKNMITVLKHFYRRFEELNNLFLKAFFYFIIELSTARISNEHNSRSF